MSATVSRVAIVIAAYNAEQFIARCLLSAIEQRIPACEIVVVDDGSTDGTVAEVARFVERHANVQLVRQPNAGPASARNAGVAAVSGDVQALLFLDADDELDARALERLAAALNDAPEAVGAFGGIARIDEKGQRLASGWEPRRRELRGGRLCRSDSGSPLVFEMLILLNWITTPGQVLIRREIVQQLVGFRRQLRGTEDWDLWLRASLLGPFIPLGEVVLRYRQHGAQISRDYAAMERARRTMFALLLQTLPPREAALLRQARRWEDWLVGDFWLHCARQSLRARDWPLCGRHLLRAARLRLKARLGLSSLFVRQS